MYVIIVLSGLFVIAAVYGMVEFFLHQKRIYSIPIRIHVNGTRGKSSVTRLIGAALSEAGIAAITKVTGTYPRLILEDGTETVIYRKTPANIIEQLAIVKLAAERKARALVVECMALQPQYQEITERKMIHSTIGVITNVRLDHVEIMGYTLPEIAAVLGKTIPAKQHCFTSENVVLPVLQSIADKKKCSLHYVDPSDISDEEMKEFKYMEHKENVSLALAVCRHLGIEKKTALQGMYKAIPDEGVLKVHIINVQGKIIRFFNAFAANDPQSTMVIAESLLNGKKLTGTKIILINTRQDRLDRARQLSAMTGEKLGKILDYLVLIGQSTALVENLCVSSGIPRNKIINLGWTDPMNVYNAIVTMTSNESSVLAIGNMGGMGASVAQLFALRSTVYG